MLDLITCIKSFARTVETSSFSAVAREMGTTQPTISKQIAALEDYLDVQLLVRSTRKMSLTEEGLRFYEHCQSVLEALSEAESSVGKRKTPSGVLRVNCSVAFGQMQVLPRLKRFLDRYPTIKLDLSMSDQFVDLVGEGIDLAIRIGRFADPNLLSQSIGKFRFVTVASTSYLNRFGEPQVPADLLDHNCIVYTRQSTGNEWQFRGTTVVVSGSLRVNNSTALREAVLAGIGIGCSPIWAFSQELENRSLKVVLAEYEPDPIPMQVVYRRGRFQSAKVKCFIEFLMEEFQSEML
ncbi:MAG: LysR family transcriptional regulator [Leptolyngbyaceae cyanobacterium SL_7_1]|nr:LysR family transcriptional regulator [Leptolyngbyaceae cyanobacterium SL_7_1]